MIGQVGSDGRQNAPLDFPALIGKDSDNPLMINGQKIEFNTGMRSFNIACLVIFFISIVFSFPFLGFLDTPQVVFYMLFILIGLVNVAFLVANQETKAEWVRKRMFSVMMPVLLLIVLQLASLIFFLNQLDEMHDKLNNMYPVPESDQLLVQSFVVNNMLLYYMIPLFMGVSYYAYASDMGKQIDEVPKDHKGLLV